MSCLKMIDLEHLGDVLERMYQTIYKGGTLFNICVIQLKNILSILVSAGMLTNITKKRIEAFFKYVTIENLEVISKETNDIVLINTKIHEQDTFALVDYIAWITEELYKDPIMKKSLCGKRDYEGVKAVLNMYEDKKLAIFVKDNWIDVSIQNNKVFFTKRDYKSIHLYYKELGVQTTSDYGKTEVLLVKEDLLDGRIYAFLDRTIYVQTDSGYIVRIRDMGCETCTHSRMQGHILGQLDDGSLVYINEGNLICLDPNRNRRIITKNAYLGWTYISDKEVYWKSNFRKRDIELDTCDMNDITLDKIRECLKEEKICKEMLWKGLLLTLYDFSSIEVHNKLGNRLKFADFFEHPPFLFTINEIGSRLSEFEEYYYDGAIDKNEDYVEAMGYLMKLEKEELDEDETFEALEYLLENVKDNPYTRMADDTGTQLLDSLSFIFGDFNLLEDESRQDEECNDDMSDIVPDFREDLVKRVNQKIAEIEAIQEEERKKAQKAKNKKKQKDTKNKKGKKSKKPVED